MFGTWKTIEIPKIGKLRNCSIIQYFASLHHNFEIPKYSSFYISSFKILTPTRIGHRAQRLVQTETVAGEQRATSMRLSDRTDMFVSLTLIATMHRLPLERFGLNEA